MEEKDILKLLIAELNKEDVWFTTKQDPTFHDADFYYELDEYGDLTEKAQNKIVKEISDYIGDGAIYIEDAIDLWIQNNLSNCSLAYTDLIKTRFKPKPVVDQIKAYENPKLNESAVLTDIPEELSTPSKPEKWTSEMWNKYYNECKKNYTDVYLGDSTNKEYFLNQKAKQLGLKDINISEKTWREDIDKIASAYADMKERKYKELNESVRVRLDEENTKSAELISSMFTSSDFDSDSPEGQIIMRTSELFNVLSDKGYDVQVSFDNGESQSSVLLGKQGGKVIITITNNNAPLRAFASGNFELSDDNLDTLKDIQDQISSI